MNEFSFTVKHLERHIGLEEFVEKYVDIPKCAAFCQQCSEFGKNWACPSYDFSEAELWKEYRTVWVMGEQLLLSESLRQSKYSDHGVAEYIERMFRQEKTKLALQLLRLEKKYPGSRGLISDICRLCKRCARLSGKPCRYPALKRYMIEGVGGNIEKMSEELFGIKVLWADDKLPEYYVIYYALLVK